LVSGSSVVSGIECVAVRAHLGLLASRLGPCKGIPVDNQYLRANEIQAGNHLSYRGSTWMRGFIAEKPSVLIQVVQNSIVTSVVPGSLAPCAYARRKARRKVLRQTINWSKSRPLLMAALHGAVAARPDGSRGRLIPQHCTSMCFARGCIFQEESGCRRHVRLGCASSKPDRSAGLFPTRPAPAPTPNAALMSNGKANIAALLECLLAFRHGFLSPGTWHIIRCAKERAARLSHHIEQHSGRGQRR